MEEKRLEERNVLLHRTQLRPLHRLDELCLVECEYLIADGEERCAVWVCEFYE